MITMGSCLYTPDPCTLHPASCTLKKHPPTPFKGGIRNLTSHNLHPAPCTPKKHPPNPPAGAGFPLRFNLQRGNLKDQTHLTTHRSSLTTHHSQLIACLPPKRMDHICCLSDRYKLSVPCFCTMQLCHFHLQYFR